MIIMSVASSSVYKRVELEPGIYSRMTKAIETAIQQAIHATIGRIEAYAKSGASNVPVDTGLLRDSLQRLRQRKVSHYDGAR